MEKLKITINTIQHNNVSDVDRFVTMVALNDKVVNWSNTDDVEHILPIVLKGLGYEVEVERLFDGK